MTPLVTFKSAVHRQATLFQTRAHLQDKLLQRYGDYRQMECKVINSRPFEPVMTAWANHLLHTGAKVDVFSFPDAILSEVNRMGRNPEVLWLVERLRLPASEDCIPQPHYAKVFTRYTPTYPFKPSEMRKMRDLYGLLKWPFREPQNKRKLV